MKATPKTYSGSATKVAQELPVEKKIDLLRDIPLEVSAYSAELPAQLTSAEQVVELLNTRRNLLVHMEAIRRSYQQLSSSEKDKLLSTLFERYQQMNDDAYRFFDHGYAQLVLQNNKTGLFFLRKANDQIKDQFSSLAYAAAEVEADLNFEDASPTQMTTRKLDAIFRFKDAVKRDAEKHKPGFWPSYVSIIEKVKAIPAYQDFTADDASLPYVPYGNTSLPIQQASAVTQDGSAQAGYSASACQALSPYQKSPTESLYHQRPVDLLGTGVPLNFQVYKTDKPKGDLAAYNVVLTNAQQTVAQFETPVAPYIIEDLDGDKQFELVVRQYAYDPLHPVQVYRYDGCKYELDQDLEAQFK